MSTAKILGTHNTVSRSLLGLLITNVVALLLSACSSEMTMGMDADPPDMAIPADLTPPDTARLLLLRNARWPGGGREMTVGVLNQATALPFADDLSARLGVTAPASIGIKTKVQKIALPPGYTAILLPPNMSATARASLATAIVDFANKRPAAERIALYRHGATVQLFSNYLLERTKLLEALERYKNGSDGDTNPLPLVQAIGPAASDVETIGGLGPDVMRSLVVLSDTPQVVFTGLPSVFVVAATPDSAGLGAAATAIDAVRQTAFYKLSACSIEDKFSAKLRVSGMLGELEASFHATLPEEIGASCNVDLIDSAKRVFTPKIEFVFDATQRAAYDARVKAAEVAPYDDVLARSDFSLQIRLAPGQPPVVATAHLHGNSSLRCPRHHFVIQLTGPDRYLLPDSAGDEYSLISMCDDSAYVYAPTAFKLLSEDLFALKIRFVELAIDGATRGIYMLMEKTKEELVRDNAHASSVMRRQYPVGNADAFEVLHSDTPNLNDPIARWNQFAARISALKGDALIDALRSQLDLDQYLRFLAHQSILRSGDYIDEVYFVGSEQANGAGGTSETYRMMIWDPEGYTTCHSGGVNAYPDPNQLSYCAEGKIDFKILADPKVYYLFVKKMEDALNSTMTRERFLDILTKNKLELQGLLSTPAICAAMTELLKLNPGAADCTIARGLIGTRADAILAAYDARRAALLPLISAYRSKNP